MVHVDIRIIILSCSYLYHSGETVQVSNLQFENKIGSWEEIAGTYLKRESPSRLSQRNLALGTLNRIP